MSDATFTAVIRLCGIVVIFWMAAATVWSFSAGIWWLFITLMIIWGMAGIGVLFACLIAQAERDE